MSKPLCEGAGTAMHAKLCAQRVETKYARRIGVQTTSNLIVVSFRLGDGSIDGPRCHEEPHTPSGLIR